MLAVALPHHSHTKSNHRRRSIRVVDGSRYFLLVQGLVVEPRRAARRRSPYRHRRRSRSRPSPAPRSLPPAAPPSHLRTSGTRTRQVGWAGRVSTQMPRRDKRVCIPVPEDRLRRQHSLLEQLTALRARIQALPAIGDALLIRGRAGLDRWNIRSVLGPDAIIILIAQVRTFASLSNLSAVM